MTYDSAHYMISCSSVLGVEFSGTKKVSRIIKQRFPQQA